MRIDCAIDFFYHNLGEGANGNTLLNQTLYGDSTGGSIMDGYYSDGTYIYTVSGGFGEVTNVETASSLSCAGTTPDPSPSPVPQGYSQQLGYGTSSTNACNNYTGPIEGEPL
jgi:hypothetical protein